MELNIKNIVEANYNDVGNIYAQGLATNIATFQNEVPTWQAWNDSHLHFCRIAAYEKSIMLGWAALSPVSKRPVYAGVAELSIYIATNARGKGVGKMLMQQIIKESEANGIWTLQSSIFTENTISIHLHQTCGFRQVGIREKIGKKNEVWKDNVLMERRSKTI